MSISWQPTLNALRSTQVPVGLSDSRSALIAALSSAGQTYQQAGTADSAALASYQVQNTGFSSSGAQTAVTLANDALAAVNQYVLQNPGSGTMPPVSDWLSAAQAGVTSAQSSTQLTPPPAPTQPATEAALNTAVANAALFVSIFGGLSG